MDPVIEFSWRCRVLNRKHKPSSVGTVPDKLLWSRLSVWMSSSLPKMVGIAPSNWLFLKEIVVMSVMTPNPPGRVPSSLFPSRLRVPIDAFSQNGETEITIRFGLGAKYEKKSFQTSWIENKESFGLDLRKPCKWVNVLGIVPVNSLSARTNSCNRKSWSNMSGISPLNLLLARCKDSRFMRFDRRSILPENLFSPILKSTVVFIVINF